MHQAEAELKIKMCKADATTVTEGEEQLSPLGLSEYVSAMLDAILKHTKHLSSATSIDKISPSIRAFAELMQFKHKMPYEADSVLEQVWLKGQVPRMELLRITGKSDKTAKKIADYLMENQLLCTQSPSKFAPYSIHIPLQFVPFLINGLLNNADEMSLFRQLNKD
jgi:hypothetical protein